MPFRGIMITAFTLPILIIKCDNKSSQSIQARLFSDGFAAQTTIFFSKQGANRLKITSKVTEKQGRSEIPAPTTLRHEDAFTQVPQL